MEMYSTSLEDMTHNANGVKEAVIAGLAREGLLNGDADEIAQKYAVVIHKRGWLGALFNKITGADQREIVITFVKRV